MNRNMSDKLRFEEAISIHLQLRAKCSTEDAGQDRFFEAWFVSAGSEWKHTVTFRQLS